MSTVGVAGWCIRRSVKGWQDKHHSIARTTVEDRGIDHAKVATNPVEAWHGCHASLLGPSRNAQNGTGPISGQWRCERSESVFWGFTSYITVWFVQKVLSSLYAPIKYESQAPSPVHGTSSKIQLWIMSLPPQQDLDSCMHHPDPERACLFCTFVNAACHEPCSNSLQIEHLIFTGLGNLEHLSNIYSPLADH